MRRLVLILMLVLLPLRGWVGEAMAMQMLAQHMNATVSVAALADEIRAEAAFDAEMQADCHGDSHSHSHSDKHAAATGPTPADTSPSACGTCPLCQMCHSVAAPAPFTALPTPWLPHAQPTTGPARFASAPAAFALKPPIS